MSRTRREWILAVAGIIVVLIAAIVVLVTSGELEVIFFMLAAVVASLVCFDRSMERNLGSFGPWALVSLAPVLKTIPTVWYELTSGDGARFERYDHVGSLLFGICLLGAALILARASRLLGRATTRFDAAAIAGSGLIGGLAGASVAFLFDRDFGSETVARVLETSTWVVIGAMLAAIGIAASHNREPTLALTGVLSAVGATAGLLASSVAGRDFDLGWWALLFVALAISAVVDEGVLGQRVDRVLRSSVPVVVAIVAGLIGAAAAISARSDRAAWGPGWALLGLASLAMFALALASRPLDEPLEDIGRARTDPQDVGLHGDAQTFRTNALTPDLLPNPLQPAVPPPVVSPSVVSPVVRPRQAVSPSAEGLQPAQDRSVESAPAPDSVTSTHSAEPLSDRSIVASAQAAAAVRTAPSAERHSLAPLAQAHHFDPSTGLLSAAGLQHAIARAFDVPRQAGHVTIMMFNIRDLDEIEREHGRLAGAAITRAVAERISVLVPSGTGARFARSAYAVVFVGDHSDVNETIQWLAQVLLQLRAPIDGSALGGRIDVVGGMAQCYESEDAAQFVKRANVGLARAVHASEASFVAMP